jgi:hypothetical protein
MAEKHGNYFMRMSVKNDEEKEKTIENWGLSNVNEGERFVLNLNHIEEDEDGESVFYFRLDKHI